LGAGRLPTDDKNFVFARNSSLTLASPQPQTSLVDLEALEVLEVLEVLEALEDLEDLATQKILIKNNLILSSL
jgi:hypothetical protein